MKKYHIEGDYEIGEDNVVGFDVVDAADKHIYLHGYSAASFIREHGKEIKEPVTYCSGDEFWNEDGEKYRIIVVELSCEPGRLRAFLMGMKSYNRWGEAVMVHNISSITELEFSEMCGGEERLFTKIEDAE